MKHPLNFATTAFAALLLTASATAQQQEAKADGKAFAESLRGEAQQAAQQQPNAATIPNYDRNAVRGLETLAEDPDRIESNAATAASGHQGYRAMRDSLANRAAAWRSRGTREAASRCLPDRARPGPSPRPATPEQGSTSRRASARYRY